ncbi:H-hydrate dehydratase [Mariannaea sp. PMI_226]|nr:H-hydrate dehydratase [Mariannaea sp. PMI_226]
MPTPSATSEMSAASKDILSRVRRMVPPMLQHFHKGQLGRVAVLGGSEDYTGAPYFSAMASARLGCDMSHVICTPAAAAVIKTYSPNLMVHPLMRQTDPSTRASEASTSSHSKDPNSDPEHISSRVIELLPRLHVLVIGPGLGRDPLMQATVARVIRAARERNMPIVLDADALLIVQRNPDLIRGYANAVLTPNVVEFGRLCEALNLKVPDDAGETANVEALAKALGGVTIIEKGNQDHISNGDMTFTVDLQGGRKRSGGQGDTLTGAIATLLGWRKAYLDRLWEIDHEPLGESESLGLAAFGGSAITRECSRLAFAKKGRSLQASDLTEEVHTAFLNLFGQVDEDNERFSRF